MSIDIHQLAAAYALDALDPDERRRFQGHYSSCEQCSQELAGYWPTAARLAGAVAVAPPDHLRQRVLAEVSATRQLTPVVPIRSASGAQRRAGLVLAVAAALMAVVASTALVRDAVRERDRAQELAEVVTAPDASIVPLEGELASTLRVVWSPSEQAAVVVGAGVADPGEGRVYELWALPEDGPPVSAGTFTPGPGGEVRTVLDLPAEPGAGWGVTNEPTGGSPQPTGDILFQGPA